MIFDFIDANCQFWHPDFEPLATKDILRHAKEAGLGGAIHIAPGPEDWKVSQKQVLESSFQLIRAFGLHPVRVAELEDETELENQLNELAGYIKDSQALGAIGLDYRPAIMKDSMELQLTAFEEQLELAEAFDLPILLHLKQSHSAAIKLLDIWGYPSKKGILVDFSGGLTEAQDWVSRGFCLSIGSRTLRKASRKLTAAICEIPLENLVIESSSPHYFPFGRQPAKTHPWDLWEVAHHVGRLRQYRASELLEISTANIKRIICP